MNRKTEHGSHPHTDRVSLTAGNWIALVALAASVSGSVIGFAWREGAAIKEGFAVLRERVAKLEVQITNIPARVRGERVKDSTAQSP